MLNVLILEDEQFARVELKRLLDQSGFDIHVLACLDSIEESVRWLTTHPTPDLIFMDIQLSDGLSFGIFDQIRIQTPVIFTTAYNEYALQAFKVNSIDYLLKPIDPADLHISLQKYTDLKHLYTESQLAETKAQLEQLLQRGDQRYKIRFLAKIGDRFQHIQVGDVAYCYAEGKTVSLVTTENKEFVIDYTLDHLEAILNPTQFFRLNRQYLVKIDAIDQVSKHFDGRFKVSLRPPTKRPIFISRRRVTEFKAWLDS